MYNSLIEKAKTIHNLSVEEIVEILLNADESLYAAADEIRHKYVGDDVHLRGLIEFSNICKNCIKSVCCRLHIDSYISLYCL